jgi:hypothetical protein
MLALVFAHISYRVLSGAKEWIGLVGFGGLYVYVPRLLLVVPLVTHAPWYTPLAKSLDCQWVLRAILNQ